MFKWSLKEAFSARQKMFYMLKEGLNKWVLLNRQLSSARRVQQS